MSRWEHRGTIEIGMAVIYTAVAVIVSERLAVFCRDDCPTSTYHQLAQFLPGYPPAANIIGNITFIPRGRHQTFLSVRLLSIKPHTLLSPTPCPKNATTRCRQRSIRLP